VCKLPTGLERGERAGEEEEEELWGGVVASSFLNGKPFQLQNVLDLSTAKSSVVIFHVPPAN